jgi:THO complex subunit 2
VKDIYSRGSSIVDQSILKTTLEVNLLIGAGITRDEKGIQQKLVLINTRILYKQKKFNIAREETEGYSKLIVLLNSFPTSSGVTGFDDADDLCDSSIKNVLSVIGQFDLDPNRVIDVTLDAFEQQPWNLNFVKLLRLFCHHR